GCVLNVDPAIGDVRRRRSFSCESDAEQHAERHEAHKVLEDDRRPHTFARSGLTSGGDDGTLPPRGSFGVRRTPRSAAGASDASRGPLEREARRLSADQGGPEPLTKVSRLWTRAISTAAARRWDRCASTCRYSTT